MQRACFGFLKKWLTTLDRKPLVIRGARQVGKTWIVRELAKSANKKLIEINFEKEAKLAEFFTSNKPDQILLNLEAYLGHPIDVGACILFLDEIQAAPEILAKLRWLYEELPALPVIAAGSLLEFILVQYNFSVPVGRISYMYLEPLSFKEYLLAQQKKILCEYLEKYTFEQDIPSVIHEELISLYKEYTIIGGMPAAVSSWIKERSLGAINQIHHDLLATFRDDFNKYRGSYNISDTLDEVMMGVPKMLGQKFIYSRINPQNNSATIKYSLKLLNQARICYRVISTAANGVPLAAEVRDKFFKEIFLDSGLVCTALGLSLNQINTTQELNLINNGGLAEQTVGQTLRTLSPFYVEPTLYYWHREIVGSNAEIDYVIQHGNQVVPIEVKAGSTGSLKSLHLFMELKNISLGIRINSDIPSKTEVKIKSHTANKTVEYTLLSLPFYLASEIHRLLDI